MLTFYTNGVHDFLANIAELVERTRGCARIGCHSCTESIAMEMKRIREQSIVIFQFSGIRQPAEQ